MDLTNKKIAIVTGANGSVGSGIVERMLERGDTIVVMACRNYTRANAVRSRLLEKYPYGHVDIELVDHDNVNSIFRFCFAIRQKYPHINYLFFNAAILYAAGLRYLNLPWTMLTDIKALAERTDMAIQTVGDLNEHGMGKVFGTNTFAHFVMMRELEQHLANSGDGRVVWTSSVTSDRSCFDLEDWQGINNPTPYESSKWACDLLAIASNQLFEKRKLPITSFTTSPGVASSGIGNFPLWVVQGRTPMHLLFRLFGVTSQNVSGYNAAGGDAAVTSQKLDDLDYHCRYSSMTDRWGTPYVEAHEVTGYDPIEAGILLRKCENAYRESKTDYRANAIKLV